MRLRYSRIIYIKIYNKLCARDEHDTVQCIYFIYKYV